MCIKYLKVFIESGKNALVQQVVCGMAVLCDRNKEEKALLFIIYEIGLEKDSFLSALSCVVQEYVTVGIFEEPGLKIERKRSLW